MKTKKRSVIVLCIALVLILAGSILAGMYNSSNGSVTVVNTFHRLAPISRAASSMEGSMFFSRPFSIRETTGKKVRVCTIIMPQSP